MGFTGSLIAAQSGRYLAERDLPMGRLMRCGENLAQSLPAALRFSHRSIGLASIQIDAGEDCVVLHAGTADGSSLSHGECQQALAAVAVLCRNALAGTYQSGATGRSEEKIKRYKKNKNIRQLRQV